MAKNRDESDETRSNYYDSSKRSRRQKVYFSIIKNTQTS